MTAIRARWHQLPSSVRVTVVALAGVLAAMAVLTGVVYPQTLSGARADAEGEAEALIRSLTVNTDEVFAARDARELGERLALVAATDAIVAVSAYDTTGALLAGSPAPSAGIGAAAVEGRAAPFAWVDGDLLATTRILGPNGEILGALSVEVSGEPIAVRMRQLLTRAGGATALILIFAVTVIGFLRRQAARERQAQELALEQATRLDAVGRLAAGVAHDFNNLLTVVLANLEEAAAVAAPAMRTRLDQAREAARGAADLSQQLLAVGRTTRGAREPVRLATVVEDAVRISRRTLGPKVRPEMMIPADLGVLANPPQLMRVLINLAMNARDAMPAGGRLTIAAVPEPAPPPELQLPSREHGYVRIVVRDEGQGMEPEVAAHVFEPFFSTKGEAGTGLGAAVAYGIVREHEGQISVESTPGAGTAFQIFLPAAPAPAPTDMPRLPVPQRPGARVLIVEDMAPVRQMAQTIFERAGHQAAGVATAGHALEIARRADPAFDLIVVDWSLPDRSGREVYETLRREGVHSPVLFMTGFADDALDSLMPRPDWAVVMKPFRSPELLRAGEGLIRTRHLEHAPPPIK